MPARREPGRIIPALRWCLIPVDVAEGKRWFDNLPHKANRNGLAGDPGRRFRQGQRSFPGVPDD